MQALTEVLPLVGLYRPTAQAVQEGAPLEDQEPAGHVMQSLAMALPRLGLNEPAAQAMQALTEVLPLVGLYLPAAQAVHALSEVLPLLGLYRPTAQAVQEGAPLEDQVPAAQGVQLAPLVSKE